MTASPFVLLFKCQTATHRHRPAFDRAMQYSRDASARAERPRGPGSPAFADDDSGDCGWHLFQARLRVLAARYARVLRWSLPSEIKEGAGNAGRRPRPWPACKKVSRRQLPQVQPDHPGIPCAMVLTLMARSPWEPGFVAPIAREIILSRTWPQRREARTTRFCVRVGIVRLRTSAATRHVHRIPRPTFVTTAKRPSR